MDGRRPEAVAAVLNSLLTPDSSLLVSSTPASSRSHCVGHCPGSAASWHGPPMAMAMPMPMAPMAAVRACGHSRPGRCAATAPSALQTCQRVTSRRHSCLTCPPERRRFRWQPRHPRRERSLARHFAGNPSDLLWLTADSVAGKPGTGRSRARGLPNCTHTGHKHSRGALSGQAGELRTVVARLTRSSAQLGAG